MMEVIHSKVRAHLEKILRDFQAGSLGKEEGFNEGDTHFVGILQNRRASAKW